jgi:hypothetical protein
MDATYSVGGRPARRNGLEAIKIRLLETLQSAFANCGHAAALALGSNVP